MVEASPSMTLPVGVLLQPMVVPSNEVDVHNFPVLMLNKFKRSTVIPIGTVVGHLYPIDPVKPIGKAEPVTEQHIRTSDSRSFWEWLRRQSLADIDVVQKHLQDLLKAGITKEFPHSDSSQKERNRVPTLFQR